MEHRMKLRNKPFEQIKNNKKTIEMRLYDEKRKQIKEKDTIIFTNIETNEELKVEVEKLYIFNNFEELYNYFDKKELGYENEEASYKDMEAYYSKQKQKEYLVLYRLSLRRGVPVCPVGTNLALYRCFGRWTF